MQISIYLIVIFSKKITTKTFVTAHYKTAENGPSVKNGPSVNWCATFFYLIDSISSNLLSINNKKFLHLPNIDYDGINWDNGHCTFRLRLQNRYTTYFNRQIVSEINENKLSNRNYFFLKFIFKEIEGRQSSFYWN